MIVVRLWGGLGNQMFQYAFAYAVAKQLNSELLLDTRFYSDDFITHNPHFTRQKLNLFSLNIDFRREINRESELHIINRLQNRMASRVIRIPPFFSIRADQGLKYIKETRLKVYKNLIDSPVDNAYYDGYWQSEDYFEWERQDIIRQYNFTNEKIENYISQYPVKNQNSVSVHMRLGDYGRKRSILAQYNYMLSPKYYLKAMKYIESKVRNPKFYIFSNDTAKAKEIIADSFDIEIINEDRYLTDLEELMVMSKCCNHIISNSTYSWWAAWLNDVGLTMAPNIEFGNSSIIPQKWVRIDVE